MGHDDQRRVSAGTAACATRWPRGARRNKGYRMATKAEEAWTQLATRIPKTLHRRLKLHCVTNDMALMHFVVQAIEEKLGGARSKKRTA